MGDLVYPELSYDVQGAFYEVHNALKRFELSEAGWESALMIALEERGIPAQRQVEYELFYKGYRIGRFFVDVVVDDRLLLELKVKKALGPIDRAQVITYLRVSGLELGILVNFGGARVVFERLPNYVSQRRAGGPPTGVLEVADGSLYPGLMRELQAALYEVHGELGPGLMHMHYRRATQIELRQRDVPYRVKKEIDILFRGRPVETRETRLLIVDEKVVLAPVAVREITRGLKGRLRHYLRWLDFRLGLVANFHAPGLELEVVRV